MKEIGAYDAKTHLPGLLESVLKGESFIITRRGKPVAVLSPVNQAFPTPQSIIDGIQSLREGVSWGNDESIKDAIEKGRK